MRADPFAQLKLLDVQELDTRLDDLRHQAANPPEAGELHELAAGRSAVAGQVGRLEVEVDDLTREQRKADDDVEHVKGRRVRDQQRLDSGAVTNPKDLERLQHELVSLDKRISDLEDAELDVMERLEAAQQQLVALRTDLSVSEERSAELTEARDKRVTALREESERVARDRAAAVQGLPADLLTLYERLREHKGGVGAALLRARRCEGCSLQLNNAEFASIAKQPPDEVIRCEECSRILVRTGESGL